MCLSDDFPIEFQNDAICFALGEYWSGSSQLYKKVVALTIGTGFGAAFLDDGYPLKKGKGVPEGGTLYQLPYRDGQAEDYFSSRGLLKRHFQLSGKKIKEVKTIYEQAKNSDELSKKTFTDFGRELASFLAPKLRAFQADCLVLGGSISKASEYFMKDMKNEFHEKGLSVNIIKTSLGEKSAILGAASLLKDMPTRAEKLRKTNQPVLPLQKKQSGKKNYEIYPVFKLDDKKIHTGISSLINYIKNQKKIIIDGYVGIFWNELKNDICRSLEADGLSFQIQDTETWLHSEDFINRSVEPYLGERDSVWGKKCDTKLIDFFQQEAIADYKPDPAVDINIVIGVGAALVDWNAPVIYMDLPKNELQYRMRAEKITNLGCNSTDDPMQMYKRFYFVDWVVLNRHKKSILNRIKVIADSQRPDLITWMFTENLWDALETMSRNVFRVRPWFEPGAWGGQWIKKHIKGLNRREINYAWSFELITPENGLIFESNETLLEVSFDLLMFKHNSNILGEKHAERFGDEFPIRFDFLDTVEGGNLSIQCHPSTDYIRENFGENFTQDETYYILDTTEDAGVYLGFQENIDPTLFRNELEESLNKKNPVEITDHVQWHPAKKHDLFLIPHGTIHSSGTGNLVLEISATPYIFTFKMYDWLRLDLNGEPRPINIDHAFNNLNFSRKGDSVKTELISSPYTLDSGTDWELIHLPTHPTHFYDVHRYDFTNEVEIHTGGSCHVLMLVEGTTILLETKYGFQQRFHYAETFVVPSAAETYTLKNEGNGPVKVIKAFLKE